MFDKAISGGENRMQNYFVNPVLSNLICCIYFWICAVEPNSNLISILNWFRFLVDLSRDPFKAVQIKATTLNKTVNKNFWINEETRIGLEAPKSRW